MSAGDRSNCRNVRWSRRRAEYYRGLAQRTCKSSAKADRDNSASRAMLWRFTLTGGVGDRWSPVGGRWMARSGGRAHLTIGTPSWPTLGAKRHDEVARILGRLQQAASGASEAADWA